MFVFFEVSIGPESILLDCESEPVVAGLARNPGKSSDGKGLKLQS